jgi:hypothetical protein
MLIAAGCSRKAADTAGRTAAQAAAEPARDATGALAARVARLEQRLQRARDLRDILHLQRIYGYYVDIADWDDVSGLLTDDATAEYGASGVYVGKDHVGAFLRAMNGGRDGLELGVLNEHVQLQPVIDIAPDGKTAKGRWRMLGLLGRYHKDARWQAGPYENEYRKVDGKWKISRIHWAETFTVPYAGGLTAGEEPAPARDVPPPDRPSTIEDAPWPAVTQLPYHFTSSAAGGEPAGAAAESSSGASEGAMPARGAAASGPASGAPADLAVLHARAGAVARQLQRLEDERQIEILQRTYGYYVDKNLWKQIADMFAANGTLEIGGRGVFVGRKRVLQYLDWLGDPVKGRLYDHTQMQGVVDVAPDGKTAKGRWRALVFGGNEGGVSVFGDCIYENEYVKENGVWKFAKEHSYFIMYTNWGQGWQKMGWPNTRPEKDIPPDQPPTVVYDMYPGKLTAPFHYANPVTGAPPPERGPESGPVRLGAQAQDSTAAASESAAATAAPASSSAKSEAAAPAEPAALAAELDGLERRVGRLEDAASVERLQNVYAYYLDDHDWDAVADLFAPDGTFELAQRGVYVGPKRIRRSLDLLGPEGSHDGHIDRHFHYQYVTHVAPDGKSAKLRGREFMMSGEYGKGARVGGGVYENQFVKQDGVWKIAQLHLYTTFLADYAKGWAHGALPIAGESTDLPPDRPPSVVYQAFPAFNFLPPFHYDNPVTGRPALPRE